MILLIGHDKIDIRSAVLKALEMSATVLSKAELVSTDGSSRESSPSTGFSSSSAVVLASEVPSEGNTPAGEINLLRRDVLVVVLDALLPDFFFLGLGGHFPSCTASSLYSKTL